jgi:hypothetical protein
VTAPSPPPAFPGQEPGERIDAVIHRHWLSLLRDAAPAVGITLLTVIAWFLPIGPEMDTASRHLIVIVLSVLLIALHGYAASRLYGHFLRAMILTDRKLHHIRKTLLHRDDQRSIEFPILLNVRKHQRGIHQTLLQYGSLILETPETSLTLRFVPRVDEVLGSIMAKKAESRPDPKAVLEDVKTVAESVTNA